MNIRLSVCGSRRTGQCAISPLRQHTLELQEEGGNSYQRPAFSQKMVQQKPTESTFLGKKVLSSLLLMVRLSAIYTIYNFAMWTVNKSVAFIVLTIINGPSVRC